jgi:hypothetical protein
MTIISSVEKKARKELRLAKYFKIHDSILILNERGLNTVEFIFARELLSAVFHGRLKISVVHQLPRKKQSTKKLLIPSSIDADVIKGFNYFISKTSNDSISVGVKIFSSIAREEMMSYLKDGKIHFEKPLDDTNIFLESVEKLYPGTKNTLQKSLHYLRDDA